MKKGQAADRLRGRFTRRSLLVAMGQAGLFGVLGHRLNYLQMVEGKKYERLADRNRISIQLDAPERGRIVDRFGRVLASNRQNLRLSVIPAHAGELDDLLARIAAIVDLDERQRRRFLRTVRRQNPHLPVTLAENLTWSQFAKANIAAPDLPGVRPEVGAVRQYMQSQELAHITGYVGAVAKTDLTGDPLLSLPGFRVGKMGVEKGFDTALRGKAGVRKLEVNARGRVLRELDAMAPRKGGELVLTVDTDVQSFAMERLGEEKAAAVAIDIQTGDVLALASTPSFDPNDFVFGISSNDWQAINADPADPLSSKALRGQYPPGSTFKMVTALAGLEAGVITPKTKFWCSGALWYQKHLYHCWKKRGHRGVRLNKAIKQSCDSYFYQVARRVGPSKIAAMGRKLGLGQVYDFGLPGEKEGVMPDPAWKRAVLGKPWYDGETLIAGIGQGYVLTTPLQLAVMTARIASGLEVKPRIARVGQAPSFRPLDIAPEHLDIVRQGMTDVVSWRGTAGASQMPKPYPKMAGKTGTSQVRRITQQERARGKKKNWQLEWEERDHALFVAFAPVEAPRYAVSVIVEHGGGGSRAAAPVARDIMMKLFDLNPAGKPAYVAAKPQRREALAAGNRERRG